MEFIWRPDYFELGLRPQVFTHVMYDFEVSPFDLIVDGHEKIEPVPEEEDNDKDEEEEENSKNDTEEEES